MVIGVVALDLMVLLETDADEASVQEAIDIITHAINQLWNQSQGDDGHYIL